MPEIEKLQWEDRDYFFPGIGGVLPHGALIVDEIVYKKGLNSLDFPLRESYVLALTHSRHSPYVTWYRRVELGQTAVSPAVLLDVTSYGNYWSDLETAAKSLKDRARGKKITIEPAYEGV